MNLCILDLFPDFFLRNIAHVEWEPIYLTVFLDLIFDPSLQLPYPLFSVFHPVKCRLTVRVFLLRALGSDWVPLSRPRNF
jgi:hypothetical protein